MYDNIECIIPFRLNLIDRLNNLNCLLDFFNKFYSQIKITICEQDVFNKIKDKRTLFLYNDNPFNKGWGLNCAAKKSDKEYLFFWDSDMIVEPCFFDKSLKLFTKYDIVKPYFYNKVYDVDYQSTNLFRKTLNFSLLKNSYHRYGCPYTGGIFGIKKSLFLEINGFFENFEGWGCEDEAFFTKISNKSYIQTQNNGYHLYHKRDIFDKAYHPLYNKNVEILSNLDNIKNCDIGNIEKYSCKINLK